MIKFCDKGIEKPVKVIQKGFRRIDIIFFESIIKIFHLSQNQFFKIYNMNKINAF